MTPPPNWPFPTWHGIPVPKPKPVPTPRQKKPAYPPGEPAPF